MNGDGKADIVASNRGTTDSLSVLLGNGNGTFTAPTNITLGGDPSSVTLTDINGDGKLDAITTNRTSNSIAVLIGNGSGGFQPSVTYATGTSPVDLAVGDFNRDGAVDLGVANLNGANISVLIANAAPFDLTSAANARASLTRYGQYRTLISTKLSQIGAFQSGLEAFGRNLDSLKLNIETALSRIEDADIAAEAAALVSTQILQQTGAAVLAQANLAPTVVLSVLAN